MREGDQKTLLSSRIGVRSPQLKEGTPNITSFSRERFDRVQSCGLASRIISEGYADERGEYYRRKDRYRRDQSRPVQGVRDNDRSGDTKRDSQYPSGG